MPHSIQIPKPKNEQDFESMCRHIYGIHYKTLAKFFGRRGQKQHGIDIILCKDDIEDKEHRIGIQCKHVQMLSLDKESGDSVCKEIKKAEDGNMPISHLVIATTLPNDASLTNAVQNLSDKRKDNDKFTVSIHFWGDIEGLITDYPSLEKKYRIPDDYIESILKQSSKKLEQGKFNELIEILTDDIDIIAFTIEQQIKRLRHLAIAQNCLGNTIMSLNILEEAIQLEKENEDLIALKISFLLTYDIEQGQELLNKSLCKSPDNESFLIEKIRYDIIFKKVLLNFDLLPNNLKKNINVKRLYLGQDIVTNSLNSFFNRFTEMLTVEEQNSFLSKKLYLNACLNELANKMFQDKIIIFADDTKKLTEALNYFEPRVTKLWNIEYKTQLPDLVDIIVSSYSILGNYDEAYSVFKEAKGYQLELDEDLKEKYIEVLVHCAPALIDEEISNNLISFSGKNLVYLSNLSLMLNKGEILQKIFNRLKEIGSQDEINCSQSLLWSYKKENNLLDLQEIENSSLFSSKDITSLCITGNFLFGFNKELFEKINNYLLEITTEESSLVDQRRFSYFLTNTKQYKEAIPFLERLTLNEDTYSLNHERLILCNLEERRYKKAKELIDIFLDKYKESEAIRVYATNLAKKTKDWKFLEHIAKIEEEINPTHAMTWLIKIEVYHKLRNKNQTKQLIKSIPEKLDGTPESIGSIALQEIYNNYLDKGFKRLYKTLRLHYQNPQIREIYFHAIMAEAFGHVLFMGFLDHPKQVNIGTKLVCLNESNEKYEIYIDIEDGLPQREPFISPSNPLFSKIENKTINNTFEFNNSIWTIDKIENIYVAVNHLILSANPLTTPELPNIKSFKADLNDQESIQNWLDKMTAPIKKQREQIKHALKIYSEHPYFTLGLLNNITGVKLYKFLCEWPTDPNTPLFISEYPYLEKNIAIEAIHNLENNSPCVIDSISLFEIIQYDMWDILNFIPNIIVPTITYETIKLWIEDINLRLNHSKGLLTITDENKPVFIDNKNNKIYFNELKQQFETILDFIENTCEISPVYGPEKPNQALLDAYEIFSKEENMILQLCEEKSAILLSIDSRFRSFATIFQIKTFHPNLYTEHLLKSNKIHPNYFYNSQLLQYINNRRPSLGISMAHACFFAIQKVNNLKQILYTLKEDFKITKNIRFAIERIFNFFEACFKEAICYFTFGAAAKIMSYLLSGIFFNPLCDQELVITLVKDKIKYTFLSAFEYFTELIDFETIKNDQNISIEQLTISYIYSIPRITLKDVDE